MFLDTSWRQELRHLKYVYLYSSMYKYYNHDKHASSIILETYCISLSIIRQLLCFPARFLLPSPGEGGTCSRWPSGDSSLGSQPRGNLVSRSNPPFSIMGQCNRTQYISPNISIPSHRASAISRPLGLVLLPFCSPAACLQPQHACLALPPDGSYTFPIRIRKMMTFG